MSKDIPETINIGTAIAQRITSALLGEGIPYDRLSSIVYKECRAIANEQQLGDWLEMPNGDTYTKTYTVERRK